MENRRFGTTQSSKAKVSGVATLSGGTATVTTPRVSTASKITLTAQDGAIPPGVDDINIGTLWVSARTEGVSFTIASSNINDSRSVAWSME